VPKTIVVEAEPEATQEKKNPPDVRFERMDEEQLRTLQEVFTRLRELTKFEEDSLGNAR